MLIYRMLNPNMLFHIVLDHSICTVADSCWLYGCFCVRKIKVY